MLQKLLPVIVIVIAGLVGGGGGFFAKSMMSGGGGDKEAAHEEDADGHGKEKKKKGGGHGEEDTGSTSYMKFSRQFVVPVVRRGKPKSMVILDINIEVDNSQGESVYSLEPRLRDAILTRLLALAGEDMLPQMLEDVDKMELMKAALLETSREIMGDAALNILILDLGIQNY
ncbi:flagellar basal body-associated FliL family protein [Marinicaulis aureus]|uniref:Flagellar basal body-associated FliL family protein n=1 Tax=Hyphococcus aureus TaxID=2666033 RepID=A0ABW1KQ74_9PROT